MEIESDLESKAARELARAEAAVRIWRKRRNEEIEDLRAEGETLAAIATAYGLTRERVRQIEAQALGRLRHPQRSRQLKGFL